MNGPVHGRPARAGFTLLELVLATGLAALLMVAVFALIDTSMTTLRRSEERRGQVELASGVLSLLEHDLRQLEGGARGDLVCEWVRVDLDGDGTSEKALPLIRLVRQASAAEVARHRAGLAADLAARTPPAEPAAARARSRTPEQEPAAPPARPEPGGSALMEVCWAVFPEGRELEQRSVGRLWRAERLQGDADGPSFFEAAFLGREGLPSSDLLAEVSGGILHLELRFASQTSILHGGWGIGPELADVAGSWDAWGRGRPNEMMHLWNEPAGWSPRDGELPVLPRRVRIELEVERPADRLRRPRLAQELPASGQQLVVDLPEHLPQAGEGERYLLLGPEWMRIRSVQGSSVTVERAQRGSAPAFHAQGTLVQHGLRTLREVPVPLFREDWGL